MPSLNELGDVIRFQDTGAITESALTDIVVPEDHEWLVQSILWRYAATATLSDRTPIIEFLLSDGTTEFFELRKHGQTLSPNNVRNMAWIAGANRPGTTDGQYETQGMPLIALGPGEIIRPRDLAGIDGNDSVHLRVCYVEQRFRR